MNFIPLRHDRAYSLIDNVMKQAEAYAKQVGTTQNLKMRVEVLRPVHLGLAATNYKLAYNAGNETKYTLSQNCGIFLAGIVQYESGMTDVTIRKGQELLGVWNTRPVFKYQEQAGVYTGSAEKYQFRSSESLGVQIAGVTADPDAWFIGYAVMPESLVNSKIVA